jgi:hypothetical protein
MTIICWSVMTMARAVFSAGACAHREAGRSAAEQGVDAIL